MGLFFFWASGRQIHFGEIFLGFETLKTEKKPFGNTNEGGRTTSHLTSLRPGVVTVTTTMVSRSIKLGQAGDEVAQEPGRFCGFGLGKRGKAVFRLRDEEMVFNVFCAIFGWFVRVIGEF